jgi:hypothetical protein
VASNAGAKTEFIHRKLCKFSVDLNFGRDVPFYHTLHFPSKSPRHPFKNPLRLRGR